MGDVRRHGHGAEEVGIAPRGLSGGEEAIMMQHRAGSQRIAKGDVSSRPPRPVGGVLVALPGPWAGTASRAFSPASPRPLGLSGPRFPAPGHPDACGARRRGPCPQGPMDRARPSQPPWPERRGPRRRTPCRERRNPGYEQGRPSSRRPRRPRPARPQPSAPGPRRERRLHGFGSLQGGTGSAVLAAAGAGPRAAPARKGAGRALSPPPPSHPRPGSGCGRPGLAEAPSRPSRESLKNAESLRVASRSK